MLRAVRRIMYLVVLVATLLAAGCVSLRAPDGATTFVVQSPARLQAKLEKITAWQTRGALSVVKAGKADIANYHWQQGSAHDYKIRISSALAIYQLLLVRNAQGVTLYKNGARLLQAQTPEKLLLKAVGWYLPVRPLRYWYRGMVAPSTFGKAVAQYDQYGHLVALKQSGWQIQLGHYVSLKKIGVDLPQLLILKHNDLSVKIITKKWRLGSQTV